MENGGWYIRPARDFERLKSERKRLATFSIAPGWPVSFISPEDCATAGFFFLGDGDKVQCAFCRGIVGEWEVSDQPISEHRRHFPRCPFVRNLPVGNIPIGQEKEIALQRQRDEMLGTDVCGPFAPVIRSSSGSTDPKTSTVRGPQPLNGNMDDLVGLGIKTCGNGPVHTNLVTQSARMKTFSNWPSSTSQSAEAMAEAGFFYMGMLDHIKCFNCDGGLRNWEEPSDDPWREHARWFPNCTFVLLNKGNKFVKKVNEDKPPVIPQQVSLINELTETKLTVTRPLIVSSVLNQTCACAFLQYLLKQAGVSREPRRVSDQELRDLIDTPIVQAALEMGMEVGKVKGTLQRKIQQTGQPFLTTESLLEAIQGRNYESESDPDSNIDDDEEEETLTFRRPPAISTVGAGHRAAFSAQESSSAEASSYSAEYSSGSGDEDMPVASARGKAKDSGQRRLPAPLLFAPEESQMDLSQLLQQNTGESTLSGIDSRACTGSSSGSESQTIPTELKNPRQCKRPRNSKKGKHGKRQKKQHQVKASVPTKSFDEANTPDHILKMKMSSIIHDEDEAIETSSDIANNDPNLFMGEGFGTNDEDISQEDNLNRFLLFCLINCFTSTMENMANNVLTAPNDLVNNLRNCLQQIHLLWNTAVGPDNPYRLQEHAMWRSEGSLNFPDSNGIPPRDNSHLDVPTMVSEGTTSETNQLPTATALTNNHPSGYILPTEIFNPTTANSSTVAAFSEPGPSRIPTFANDSPSVTIPSPQTSLRQRSAGQSMAPPPSGHPSINVVRPK